MCVYILYVRVCVLCLCVYIYLKTTQNMHNLFIIKRNRLGLICNSFSKKNVNFLLLLLKKNQHRK
jgi:hypothetical protein